MKSSKFKKISATPLFPFEKKKFNPEFCSAGRIAAVLSLILCLALIFSFTLTAAGCDVLGRLASAVPDADSLNDNIDGNKDTEGSQQVNGDNGQEQENGEETSLPEEEENGTAESTESAQETAPVETTEETDPIDTSEQTINVYYADSAAEYLVGEARTVSGISKLVDAIYELMKEPIDSSLFVLIPSTTKINSIKVINRIARVDLSQSFMDDRFVGDTADILLIYSIVNTLTEFNEVEAVEFYIDGEKLEIFGQLSVDEPIYRKSDLIKNQ